MQKLALIQPRAELSDFGQPINPPHPSWGKMTSMPTSRPSTTNNILLSALLARHIHFGCSVAAQRRPEGQMEKQIQKAPDEIQFNSEMKQKLPTNANTARIPLLLGNYFWEMLVEETARSRPCGLHNSDPHILVGKILYQSIPLIRNHMQYVLLFSLQAA